MLAGQEKKKIIFHSYSRIEKQNRSSLAHSQVNKSSQLIESASFDGSDVVVEEQPVPAVQNDEKSDVHQNATREDKFDRRATTSRYGMSPAPSRHHLRFGTIYDGTDPIFRQPLRLLEPDRNTSLSRCYITTTIGTTIRFFFGFGKPDMFYANQSQLLYEQQQNY